MNGTLVNEYSKRNKLGKMQTNYVYKISGTKEEIEEFLASRSAKTVDSETGDNLYFTSRYFGNYCKLVITKDGWVTKDNSQERKLISLAEQFGDAGKEVIADYIRQQMGMSAPIKKSEPKKTVADVTEKDDDSGLGDL